MVGGASLPTVVIHSESPSTISARGLKRQSKHTQHTDKLVLGRAGGSSPPAWGGLLSTIEIHFGMRRRS